MFTAENYTKTFTVQFDTGNSYSVSILNTNLTWKGVAGEDLGVEISVDIKRQTLSDNIEIFQWKEPRGYFVTFVLDSVNKKGITSTKADNNQDWLVEGKIIDLE